MISVIVVSYKSDDRTIKFVREELPKITLPYSVVVVNNGADEEQSRHLVDELNANTPSSNVFVLANSENSGFAKGNNMGVRYACEHLHPEYLLFSNNDIILESPTVVEDLVNKLSTLPEAGMIGPEIVGLDGKRQSPEPYLSFWDREVLMYISTPFLSKSKKQARFKIFYSDGAQEGFHYKLMGSFFLMRTRDFLNCGMMDEHTFLFAEEHILTERLATIGLKPYFYPTVRVIHEHGATTERNFKNSYLTNLEFESECYYYKTYKKVPVFQIWIGCVIHKLRNVLK